MNNLYCGLVDAKIRASDKDLPVPGSTNKINSEYGFVVQVVYYQNHSFMHQLTQKLKSRLCSFSTKHCYKSGVQIGSQ